MEVDSATQNNAIAIEQIEFLKAQVDYLTGRVVQLQMEILAANQKLAAAENEDK